MTEHFFCFFSVFPLVVVNKASFLWKNLFVFQPTFLYPHIWWLDLAIARKLKQAYANLYREFKAFWGWILDYVEKVIHITIYNEFGWFHLKMHYTAITFHYHCSHNRNHNGLNSFLKCVVFFLAYYGTLTNGNASFLLHVNWWKILLFQKSNYLIVGVRDFECSAYWTCDITATAGFYSLESLAL